jgi:hypothetical protein
MRNSLSFWERAGVFEAKNRLIFSRFSNQALTLTLSQKERELLFQQFSKA